MMRNVTVLIFMHSAIFVRFLIVKNCVFNVAYEPRFWRLIKIYAIYNITSYLKACWNSGNNRHYPGQPSSNFFQHSKLSLPGIWDFVRVAKLTKRKFDSRCVFSSLNQYDTFFATLRNESFFPPLKTRQYKI